MKWKDNSKSEITRTQQSLSLSNAHSICYLIHFLCSITPAFSITPCMHRFYHFRFVEMLLCRIRNGRCDAKSEDHTARELDPITQSQSPKRISLFSLDWCVAAWIWPSIHGVWDGILKYNLDDFWTPWSRCVSVFGCDICVRLGYFLCALLFFVTLLSTIFLFFSPFYSRFLCSLASAIINSAGK